MGTPFRIVVCVDDSAAGMRAVDAAFDRIARLGSVLSDYDPDSEVSRLAAVQAPGTPTPVSDELAQALDLSAGWNARTGGTFDAALGSLTRLWRRAFRRGRIPDPDRVERARTSAGWRHVKWEPDRRHITFDVSGVRLDFGGIGKGLAADAALAELSDRGFPIAVIDAGGDVVAGAPPPGAPGWIVSLPGETGNGSVWLSHSAIATSGDRYHQLEVDGVRYSHILDPRTGVGLRNQRTVTVAAADGASADVLATVASVDGPDAVVSFARAVMAGGPGLEPIIAGELPVPVPANARPSDCRQTLH